VLKIRSLTLCYFGGFEVLTELTCDPVKVNRRFEGTYHPHLQGKEICQPRNQSMKQVPGRANRVRKTQNLYRLCLPIPASCWFLLGLLFDPDDGGPLPRNIGPLSPDYTALHHSCIVHVRFSIVLLSTLKMKVITSSETSVDFHQTTRRYNTVSCFMLPSCLAYYSTWNMETIPPSETSVASHQTT
jgi:hypothetical protein